MEDSSTKKGEKVKTSAGSAVYGLGFIGVLVFYLQHAPNFWLGVLGVIKAIFWPAFLMYKLFEYFKL